MGNKGYMLILDLMANVGLAASAKRDGNFADYVTTLDCVEADLISIGELLESEGVKVDWRANPMYITCTDITRLSYRLSKLDHEIEMLNEYPNVELGEFLQYVRMLKKEVF